MFEPEVWAVCDELDAASYKLEKIKLLVDDVLDHYFSYGHMTIIPTLEKIRELI